MIFFPTLASWELLARYDSRVGVMTPTYQVIAASGKEVVQG
jgi:hypothetical protein